MRLRREFASFVVSLLTIAVWVTFLAASETKRSESMEIKSSAFQDGGNIPKQFTCDGIDTSPQLRWVNAPSRTRAFAIIADDPDAPVGTWVHWVVYDLPADIKQLAEGTGTTDTLSNGAKQGVNDFRKVGYGGPCPPSGPVHRYFFKLYALDAPTNLKSRANKQQLLDSMKGHILAEAELIGRYGR
jgi:Raf kinase inhibitor-like YbhB/YbcL family protein